MNQTRKSPRTGEAIRPLVPADLDRVVAIDAIVSGRARPGFIGRRLETALRDPAAHVQCGCDQNGRLRGFLLARITEGEFGGEAPGASLDVIGVEPDARGRGIGRRLLASADEALRRRQVRRMESQAGWRNHGMLRFFDGCGFRLAPVHMLERAVATGPADDWQALGDAVAAPSAEIDYSRPPRTEALARDAVLCRSVAPADLEALVRVDRHITGADRAAWFRRTFDEIFRDQGLRVSMVAETDGLLVGFVMARVDFGGFGVLEPVAVLDTLGVDPGFTHRHVASALLSQLLVNLASLQVERIRTRVRCDQPVLLSFFLATGFRPGEDLAFVREVPA
jgi:ribosomal protein S18 acetylase RimI-like enzyme